MEVVGLIAFFSAIVLVVRTFQAIKNRGFLHKERMRALELGKVEADMYITEGQKPAAPRSHANLALHGVIWSGIGAGLLVASFILSTIIKDRDFQEFAAFLVIWSIPSLFVGLGLRHLAGKAREEEMEREARAERERREAASVPPFVPSPPRQDLGPDA